MKVLCDEHVPSALENALRGEGIETVHASDVLESGTSDDDLLEYARSERLVVLTNDSDFLDRTGHSGVLYYDDQRTPRQELVRAVRNVSDVMDGEHLENETVFLPDGWV